MVAVADFHTSARNNKDILQMVLLRMLVMMMMSEMDPLQARRLMMIILCIDSARLADWCACWLCYQYFLHY
jgi:hypothetical protein